MFLFVGATPETEWLDGSAVAVDKHSFALTGLKAGSAPGACTPGALESKVPGVFAIGDVRSGSVKRVGGAIGEGAAVVTAIHRHVGSRVVAEILGVCQSQG